MTTSQILQTALRNHVPVDLTLSRKEFCARCLNLTPISEMVEDEDGERCWCQNCVDYYEAQAEFQAADPE